VARARCGGAFHARESVLVSRAQRRALLGRHRLVEPPCGEMRIRTDTAASAASLTEYLRRCECIVEVIDDRIIDAIARPQSFAAPHADIELEGYLAVWQAMHPECSAERLSPLEHH
jgi:hypothetical protein